MNSKPATIYVLMEHGRVWEIRNIPDGTEIQVIDKDVEGEDAEDLQISPVDGEACIIQTFGPYGKNSDSGDAEGAEASA